MVGVLSYSESILLAILIVIERRIILDESMMEGSLRREEPWRCLW